MYGIMSGDRTLASSECGTVTHYITDPVTGAATEPLPNTVNVISCWGDSETVAENPSRAAVTTTGERATPDTSRQQWGTVCPTDPEYRDLLLKRIEQVGSVGDVRLTTVGFPGEAYCHCSRCLSSYRKSSAANLSNWRVRTIHDFISTAASRCLGRLYLTLYPDPFPGSLVTRNGTDPARLAPIVDGFVIPLCDVDYQTTYWVEILARGFRTRLESYDCTLTMQLASDGIPYETLIQLGTDLQSHADQIIFGTYPDSAETVAAAIAALSEDRACTQSRSVSI